MMSGRLSGKVCVITGTGKSVGSAAALAFAREGASVVGCDVNVAAAEASVEMVRAQGGTMISVQPCQLTEPSECQALVDLAVREYGRIDVLFNNAQLRSQPGTAISHGDSCHCWGNRSAVVDRNSFFNCLYRSFVTDGCGHLQLHCSLLHYSQ
jgi:NAD(P)-dependent dehydrogenase (short-subunit alcohol dehydrogenase family)